MSDLKSKVPRATPVEMFLLLLTFQLGDFCTHPMLMEV